MANTIADKKQNVANWEEYLLAFEQIIKAKNPPAPYDVPEYHNYLKLNASRQKRWLKKGMLNPELQQKIRAIDEPQTWYVITEPWCGDAAHSIPFLYLLTQENENIDFKIVWRDTAPYMIEDYLTNGGKSVPKLVVRDKNERDLFSWGPRPEPCQKIYQELKDKKADFEETKITLQQWYNKDKGETLQRELKAIVDEL